MAAKKTETAPAENTQKQAEEAEKRREEQMARISGSKQSVAKAKERWEAKRNGTWSGGTGA